MDDRTGFEQAIAAFPAMVQQVLRSSLDVDSSSGMISATDAQSIAEQLGQPIVEVMCQLLPLAQWYALPSISQFRVGAIARGLSGNLYCGGNIEFVDVALSAAVHAEQAAMVNAWAHGDEGLQAIAITDAPCGHCRQFLYELSAAASLEVVLPGKPPLLLADLLPNPFGPRDLGAAGGLMRHEDHRLILDAPSQDPLVLAALMAANRSYAPYSKGYAGVAVATTTGRMYAGSYAENAAFNPSISPMAAALAYMRLCAQPYNGVQRSVLVQAQPAPSSQVGIAQAVLKSVSPVPLTLAYAHADR